jgi:hypothetical protein
VAAIVRTVAINETNAHLLRGGFENWLPDIRYRQPFCAVVEGNRAVSICAASASPMRFTAPEWKHAPGTDDEVTPPTP